MYNPWEQIKSVKASYSKNRRNKISIERQFEVASNVYSHYLKNINNDLPDDILTHIKDILMIHEGNYKVGDKIKVEIKVSKIK